ncbi:hypothetical protein HGRIS_005689 [Hohenbuehelia grisea]|uniref:Sas10 C-terminal domain-containing protein n=1 Tax=Hohenbuehelia grisea TaxID=104357 RepID=A0ABR3JYM2_9AGAR
MVRRRVPKSRAGKGKPRPTDRADAKLKRWDKASDIPLDEEDQFHSSRDKILLEGDELDDDEDLEGEEVFGLKGLSDDEDDEEAFEDEDEDEDVEMEDVQESSSKSTKPKKKKKSAKQDVSSDEEQVEEEEETWGRGKSAYYSSNAAELSSDDEESNEMEEQEARRLQAKAREAMRDEDFGLFDAHDVADSEPGPSDLSAPATSAFSKLPTDKKALLRHLEKSNPIALALARDWEDTARSLIKTKENIKKLEADAPDALSLGMVHLHYQTLLTYASTLAFYLHLRASEKYSQRPELLDTHPILQRLLTLKQSLATLEDLDFAASDSDEDDFGSDDDGDDMADAQGLWNADREGFDADELEDLLEDAMDVEEPVPKKAKGKAKATQSISGADAQEPPKKKRKTAKASTLPAFDLIEPEFPASKRSSARHRDDAEEAHGELSSLDFADAADKSSRKRTLRFHTSRIESASARRQGARNAALGGDDDIPYRERRQEKEARLAKEIAKRERGQGGADLETEPEKAERSLGDGGDGIDEEGPDGYYELVKRKSKEKKERKKTEYDETRAAERAMIEDLDDANGPRSATRAILANKGLTPHRSKSVRNPRVKKRMKFEKAKRKVASQKAVYKGGISATGRYEGETSGISKVIKSTRLG